MRHDFCQLRGAATQVSCQGTERVEAFTDEAVDADPVGSRLVLRPLKSAEQAGRSRDGDRHESQAPQVAPPFLVVHSLD